MTVMPERDTALHARDLTSLFRAAAQRWPDHVALHVADSDYCYADLDLDARRLAATVERHAVADHPHVGIWCTRRYSDYASLLGVLYAAHTYVPLNSKYPVARNLYILEKAAIRLLLCDSSDLPELMPLLAALRTPLKLVIVDAHAIPPAVDGLPARSQLVTAGDAPAPSQALVDPDQPCYVLFTSGSTGQPKGVVISHANVISYLRGIDELCALSEQDRVTQTFELTFDLSVHDMFCCWAAGACLHVFGATDMLFPLRVINKHQISVWFSVPTQAALLDRAGQLKADTAPSLRLSLFCGEPLPQALAQRWQEAAPHSSIINLYGPTEATIAVTSYTFQHEDSFDTVPLGRPLAGGRVRIADDSGAELAEGEKGELLLAGPQLSSGYLGDADKTAQQFITLIDADGSANAWYRTGDLASWSAPHGLLFWGRLNRQVHIRGYRVELDEIEHCIRRFLPGATVAALYEPSVVDEQALVVFIDRKDIDPHAIMHECSQHLPRYMVPGAVVSIAHMPVSASGKLDYNSLHARHFGTRAQAQENKTCSMS
ncbi:MAG: amino acid adenylation domain-containing protein [Alcanivoracaceae bacterium]|nr:amino acid adenylation domain-containing protein [Alcanivoracaceae bacterium]